jgi:hypothetical protein
VVLFFTTPPLEIGGTIVTGASSMLVVDAAAETVLSDEIAAAAFSVSPLQVSNAQSPRLVSLADFSASLNWI